MFFRVGLQETQRRKLSSQSLRSSSLHSFSVDWFKIFRLISKYIKSCHNRHCQTIYLLRRKQVCLIFAAFYFRKRSKFCLVQRPATRHHKYIWNQFSHSAASREAAKRLTARYSQATYLKYKHTFYGQALKSENNYDVSTVFISKNIRLVL